MSLFRRSGRVLRIRPGHLANFSGGAGYMPFILLLSVPASVLFGIVGSLVLSFQASRLLGSDDHRKNGLYEFVRYAHWHTLVCVILGAIAGVILFCRANDMVYGSKLQYAATTAVCALWPIVAWLLSTVVLVRLIVHRGIRVANLLLAALIHMALLAAAIPLFAFASRLTEARL